MATTISENANALITEIITYAKALLLGLPDFLVQHPFWSAFFVLIIAGNASMLFDHYRAYRRRKSQSSAAINEQKDVCLRALVEIETRAGIATETAKLPGLRKYSFSYIDPDLRKLYFSVSDKK